MIDTVVLSLPRESFRAVKNASASPWELYSTGNGFEKYVKNQTYQQKNDGVYRPKLSVIKRGGLSFLRIEFSVPKLIFGNNVDEVCENDFGLVVKTLRTRLKDFGVLVPTAAIEKSTVSLFHPSKNILLSNGYTSSEVIRELNKINLSTRMDLNKDSYRNDGQSLQCYTGSHSLVIYDKIKDLKKRKKRAVDKDQTPVQSSISHTLVSLKRNIEILRIEVRLSKKAKMNAVLAKNGFNGNPIFKEVFRESVCQKITLQYWNDLVADKNIFLYSLESNPKRILERILRRKGLIKAKEAIYLTGLHQLCKDASGIRELRALLSQRSTDRTWYRISSDIKELDALQSPLLCHQWLVQARSQLQFYKPLMIKDLICPVSKL